MTAPTIRKRTNDDSGFTLTELMVTLVIIGVVMLVAIPNLQDANETYQLRQASSELETILRRARAMAVTTRTDVRVSINGATQTCIVEQDEDRDGNFDSTMRTVTLNKNVALQNLAFNGGGQITFDARGAPDNPGSLVLHVAPGKEQLLLVAAGSGAVVVRKHQPTGP